jgi:hypothetical protein
MSGFIPEWIRQQQDTDCSLQLRLAEASTKLSELVDLWVPVCNHLEHQLFTPHGVQAYTSIPSGDAGREHIARFLDLWADNFLLLGRHIAAEGLADCFGEPDFIEEQTVEASARRFVADVVNFSIAQDHPAVLSALREVHELGGGFYGAVRGQLIPCCNHTVWVLRDRLRDRIERDFGVRVRMDFINPFQQSGARTEEQPEEEDNATKERTEEQAEDQNEAGSPEGDKDRNVEADTLIEEPVEEELTDRQRWILETMLEHEIASERRRKARAAVVKLINHTHNPSSYGRAFADLAQRGLIKSREGLGGGVWLSPQGRAEARRLRSSS